jgi:hypothetical protein
LCGWIGAVARIRTEDLPVAASLQNKDITAGRSSQLSYDGLMISDVFDLFANAIFSRNIPALERRAASWRFEPGFEVSVRTLKNQP